MDELALTDGQVDLRRGVVLRGAAQVPLTTKEVDLLVYLGARPERVVGWDELHREVWHHGPSVVSRAAYFTWRRLVQKIEADPELPVHLLSHYGDGISFVPPGGARAVLAPKIRRTNLGSEGTSFVGRTAEQALFRQAWSAGARLISVVGPGGAGKTRFARHLARELADDGEVWFCALGACPPGAVAERVAQTVGLVGAAVPGVALDERRAVLILDEAEASTREVAGWVAALLLETRTVRVIVTSRERTDRPEEVTIGLAPLSESDGVRLFVDRVRQSDPTWDPDPWLGELGTLVRRLDGLPLAIELAAARARVLSPRELVQHLDARFALLRRRGDDGPHGSLHATIERSWTLLDPSARRALAQLAVFRGGFDLSAAEATLAVPDGPPVIDLVEGLCAVSLVDAIPGPSGLRFGIAESIRVFLEPQLGPAERTATRERHAAWFASRAEVWRHAALAVDPRGPAAIATDRANLEAVVDAAPDSDDGMACVLALGWEGPGRRVLDLLAAVDRCLAIATGRRRTELLLVSGAIQVQQGRIDAAESTAREAWNGADPDLGPQAAGLCATVALARGDPQGALGWLDRQDPAPGPLHVRLQLLGARSNALRELGRLRESRDAALAQLAACESAGQVRQARSARLNVALADLALGRPEAAAAELELACATAEDHDPYTFGMALNLLGCARLSLADPAGAEEALRRARDCHRTHGAVGRIAQVEANLALALRGMGRAREALALQQGVLETHRRTGHGQSELLALLNVAIDAIACDEPGLAGRALTDAERLTHEHPVARLRLGCLRAIHHACFGVAADADAALAPLRSAVTEGESAALLAVAEVFVASARAREADAPPPTASPPPDADRWHVVRFLWDLRTRAHGAVAAIHSSYQDPPGSVR